MSLVFHRVRDQRALFQTFIWKPLACHRHHRHLEDLCEPRRSHGKTRRDHKMTIPVIRAPQFLFGRSEEHTSELQSLMRISYAVFCLKKKKKITTHNNETNTINMNNNRLLV